MVYYLLFFELGIKRLARWELGFWILGENCGKYWIMHGLILGTIVIFGDGIMVL